MLSAKKFLDKYDIILFDMDGVITSEQAYWTCAALTVYEMLHSSKHYGTKQTCDADLIKSSKEIRRDIFFDDKIISVLKNCGVNSNWDLAYATLSIALTLDTHDFEKVYEYACAIEWDIFTEYDNLAEKLSAKFGEDKEKYMRGGKFWTEIQTVFQRFYLGDGGENSIINTEKPLHSMEKTKTLIKTLSQSGKTLGIGTGRPRYEAEMPLKNWGLADYFDKDRIVTMDDVLADEKLLVESAAPVALTKPHPYTFLKGALKTVYPVGKIVSGDYDKELLKKVLVVGDAGADMYSAKNAGTDFLAVLTGVSGEAARSFFEGTADYILNSVCDMIEDVCD